MIIVCFSPSRQLTLPLSDCQNSFIDAGQNQTNGNQSQSQHSDIVSLSTNANHSAVQPPSPRSSIIHHPRLGPPLLDTHFIVSFLGAPFIKWEVVLELSVSVYCIVRYFVLFAHPVFLISTATFKFPIH